MNFVKIIQISNFFGNSKKIGTVHLMIQSRQKQGAEKFFCTLLLQKIFQTPLDGYTKFGYNDKHCMEKFCYRCSLISEYPIVERQKQEVSKVQLTKILEMVF